MSRARIQSSTWVSVPSAMGLNLVIWMNRAQPQNAAGASIQNEDALAKLAPQCVIDTEGLAFDGLPAL
ncbi:MAG: hypothetical protein KF784_12695 [Fimbriimonadaceae bacterium]|nr:hypothetical protein [Fimbriimonadaceae bacterium]